MSFTLAQCTAVLGDLLLESNFDPNTVIENLSYNSKEVSPHCLFLCKGANFQPSYLEEAQKRGAICYVATKKFNDHSQYLLVSDLRLAMGKLIAFHCGELYPQRKDLPLIGITGTKGKTTTALMLRSILDTHYQKIGAKPSALLCSILCYDGIAETPSRLTTKEPMELNEHINNAYTSGCPVLTMEVSSQAVKYHRIYGLQYAMGCYLNIGEDHISPQEHPDFQDYFQSKLQFFQSCQALSVNLDGVHTETVLQAVPQGCELVTCSRQDPRADFYVVSLEKQGIGTNFLLKTPRGEEEYRLAMAGLFNLDNAMTAISVAHGLGIPHAHIAEGLLLGKATGRMEHFASANGKLQILVDYAHNKMSFQALFTSILEEFPEKKIVAVFGCPGGKALDRRGDMGQIADQYADFTYLTEDDPWHEAVEDICKEIALSMPKGQYEIQPNRKLAIEFACNLFPTEEKVVLLLGKGSETDQKRGDFYVAHPSDSALALEFLDAYDKLSALIE